MQIINNLLENISDAKRKLARVYSKWALRDLQGDFTDRDRADYYFAKTGVLKTVIDNSWDELMPKEQERLKRKMNSAWLEYLAITPKGHN